MHSSVPALWVALYVFSFISPESMTNTTSGMVMEDSAMLVASTTCHRGQGLSDEKDSQGNCQKLNAKQTT